MKMTTWLAVLGLAAIAMISASPAKALDYETVLVGGRPNGDPLGPELDDGIDWDTLSAATWYMNQTGQIAFSTQFTGVQTTSDFAVYRWSAGSKELLIREGDQAPGQSAGTNFGSFDRTMSIADDGSVWHSNRFTGSNVTLVNDDFYAFVSADNAFLVPFRQGAAPPGFGPIYSIKAVGLQADNPVWDNQGSTRLMSPDGQVMLAFEIQGPGVTESNNRLLYYGSPNSPQVLVREGDAAPGVAADALFKDPFLTGFTNGQQVFVADVVNPDASVQTVLYRHGAGNLTVVAAQGTSGGIAGLDFKFRFTEPKITPTGDVAVTAQFDINDGADTIGLFRVPASSGLVELIATQGAAAPGTDATFLNPSGGLSEPIDNVLANSGDIAFLYRLQGGTVNASNDVGIWINDELGTRLGIREGDAAGDLAGVTIGSLRAFTFNDEQNLVVITDLLGAVDGTNDRAMWLVQPDGDLELLYRKGDSFDVNPSGVSDLRTIQDFLLGGYWAGAAGRFGAFNESGQLAFGLTFTDGRSGLFAADLTPVPEPASVALILISAITLGFRRFRLTVAVDRSCPIS